MKIAMLVLLVGALLLVAAWAAYRGGTALSERLRNAPAGAAGPRPASAADAAALLAPHAQALRASERAVAQVELVAMARDDLTASKVGGAAWWPLGEPAPLDAGGKPLALLAQVNFAELSAPLDGYPQAGLLQFFVAREDDFYGANFDGDFGMAQLREQRNFRVVYWPDTARGAAALPALASERLPMDPTRPRRMRFSVGREPLSQGDYRFDRLFGGNAYGAMEAYAERRRLDPDSLADAVWELHSGAGHKLGGYPAFTQQDPRSGGPDELLLQLDSDEEMMWGDVGVANFFIAPADLARRDFSRVAYNWDCH